MLQFIFKPRTRHRILSILLVSNYFNVFAFSVFGPLFTIFALQVGATPLNVATAMALYALALGLLLMVFGRIQGRIKHKKGVVVSGYFLLAASAFSFLLADSLAAVYLVQVLVAASTAWMMPAWKTLYAKHEDSGRETEEWALADGGNQLLIAIATFVGGAVLTIVGFDFLIILMGCLQLLGAFFSLQLLSPEVSDGA